MVERAIWEVESLSRTLVHSVCEFHGIKIGASHLLRLWAVEYSSQLYNRFHKSSVDGRTPFERRKGKSYRRALPWLAEPVLYLKVASANRRKQKHEDRWETVIYVGLVERSNEVKLVRGDVGFKCNSIKHISFRPGCM